MNKILAWEDLNKIEIEDLDRVNGINNSYSNLRLFGHTEDDVIITLSRSLTSNLFKSAHVKILFIISIEAIN